MSKQPLNTQSPQDLAKTVLGQKRPYSALMNSQKEMFSGGLSLRCRNEHSGRPLIRGNKTGLRRSGLNLAINSSSPRKEKLQLHPLLGKELFPAAVFISLIKSTNKQQQQKKASQRRTPGRRKLSALEGSKQARKEGKQAGRHEDGVIPEHQAGVPSSGANIPFPRG